MRTTRLSCVTLLALTVGVALVAGGCGFFGGDGVGTGDGSGSGITDGEPVSTAVKPLPKNNEKIVSILVDGDEYKQLKPDGNTEDRDAYVAADESSLVEAAQAAQGDYGVKVRIYRRNTAVPKATQDLIDALTKAGIKSTEIEQPEGLIY